MSSGGGSLGGGAGGGGIQVDVIAISGDAAGSVYHRCFRRCQLPRFSDSGEQRPPFERWHGVKPVHPTLLFALDALTFSEIFPEVSVIMEGDRLGEIEPKPFGRGAATARHGLKCGAVPVLQGGGVTLRPVARNHHAADPWMELPENERPDRWDARLTVIVLPEHIDNVEATLGVWLKKHLSQRRNTLRFLLPKKTSTNIYFDRDLIVYARATYLANQWKETDPAFRSLHTTYQNSHLRPRLKDLFDTFAILDVWNFAQPEQCRFLIEKHNANGDKIPKAIDEKIASELFIAEDFEAAALRHATASSSLAKFIGDLQEPSIDGKNCIPWLGEVATKEKVLHLCAAGKLAINLRGLELLQAQPGETEEGAWMRIKGKLGSGKELEQTILLPPGAYPHSGGTSPPPAIPVGPQSPSPAPPGVASPPNIFGGNPAPPTSTIIPFVTPPKSPVNLLGEVEKWGINAAINVTNININVSQMTGAQLTDLLKKLPGGVLYSLSLDKETL